MAAVDDLRKQKWVVCTLCGVGFKGKKVDEHDIDPEHVRRRQSFVIDRAVAKVGRFASCNGRLFNR